MNLRTARSRGSAWLAGVFTLLATSGGCSLFYDLNTTQCEVTSDCIALGPQFADTTCSNKVCVPNSSGGMTSAGGKSGSSGGSSNASGGMANVGGGDDGGGDNGGTDSGSGGTTGTEPKGGSAGTAGAPECTSNGDCIDKHVDQPYVCMEGSCVAVTNDDCPVLIPSTGTLDLLRKPAPILIGGFASMTNDMDQHDTQAIVNWELVFNEFNAQTLGGLPVQGGEPRPMLGIICQGQTTDVNPAMDHLTKDLRVPAVLSTLSTDNLNNAYQYTQSTEYKASDRDPVFFMSTGSADLRLANLKDDGLVWHMLGDPRVLATTTASLVKRIEPYINAQRKAYFDAATDQSKAEDPSKVPLRVTLVYSDDATMIDMSSVLTTDDIEHPETLLTFNGKAAIDGANAANFRQVKIDSVKLHTMPDVSAGVTDLQTNPPHLIIAMATAEFPGTVLPSIENNWNKGASENLPRPFYLMSHLIYGTGQLQKSVGALDATLPNRIVGVNYAIAQDQHSQLLYNSYLGRLRASYDGKLQLDSTENYYDGGYSLLYSLAAAASNNSTPSGKDIRDGLKDRVFSVADDATTVDVGPKAIGGAVGKLNSDFSYSMSMWGCMGAPNFNRTSGTRVSATSAWCILKNGTSGLYQPDGLLYDTTTQEFTPPNSPATVPPCLANY